MKRIFMALLIFNITRFCFPDEHKTVIITLDLYRFDGGGQIEIYNGAYDGVLHLMDKIKSATKVDIGLALLSLNNEGCYIINVYDYDLLIEQYEISNHEDVFDTVNSQLLKCNAHQILYKMYQNYLTKLQLNAVEQNLKIEANIRDFPFIIDDGKIILEIESSKQTIKIGDSFVLIYRIINNSLSDITILPTLIWRDNEFKFYNSNGSEIRMGSTVDIVWSQYIGKDDFINIKAGQCYEAFIPVKSGHHKIELSIFNERGQLYDGPYIYFESTEWYIFLENVDELIIQGMYYLTDDEEEAMLEYGLYNGISNDLISKPLYLHIIDE